MFRKFVQSIYKLNKLNTKQSTNSGSVIIQKLFHSRSWHDPSVDIRKQERRSSSGQDVATRFFLRLTYQIPSDASRSSRPPHRPADTWATGQLCSVHCLQHRLIPHPSSSPLLRLCPRNWLTGLHLQFPRLQSVLAEATALSEESLKAQSQAQVWNRQEPHKPRPRQLWGGMVQKKDPHLPLCRQPEAIGFLYFFFFLRSKAFYKEDLLLYSHLENPIDRGAL